MILPKVEWLEPSPVTPSADVIVKIGGHPLLAELVARRELADENTIAAFLNPDLYQPADPLDLPDLAIAADRLDQAIKMGETIGVWGDFDVDGQTATTLLVSGLRTLGARVIYHIPIRASESHGVNIHNLLKLLDNGANLVLTCDTGITAHEAADFLLEKQVDFLITDHHTLPDILPNAGAVVNPQRLPGNHPLHPLCGVGTAFQLLMELLRRRGRSGDASSYLDLVAMGTIADVATLRGDNRWLVQRGLQTIRSHPRPGLQAILSLAEINPSNLTEEHISFALAPRLNAIGRLGDANPVVELLMATDVESVNHIALELESLNIRRKRLCDDVFRAAQSQIQRDPSLLDSPFLLLDSPTWPAGVIGIVASRLAELYNRPVALISSPPGQPARASARSVEGINITAALTENAELLLGYGGHPMAAGFSLLSENINKLRRGVSKSIQSQTAGISFVNRLQIDAWLPFSEASLELVEDLERLSPYGLGNPSPVFAAHSLHLVSATSLGKTGEHYQIIVEDANNQQTRLVWWNAAGNPLPSGTFDLAYHMRAVNYKGSPALTLEWVDARNLDNEAPMDLSPTLPFTVVDLRQVSDPASHLADLDLSSDLCIWWEVDPPPDVHAVDRFHLQPCHTLVIASIPPDRQILNAGILAAQPHEIILFGLNPSTAGLRNFLSRLGGLIRFVQREYNGKIKQDELVSACGTTIAAIHQGLAWWQARGVIQWKILEDGLLEFTSSIPSEPAALSEIEKQLSILLDEISAFRSYYLRTPVNSIFGS